MTPTTKYAYDRLWKLNDHRALQEYGPDLLIQDVETVVGALATTERELSSLQRQLAEAQGERDALRAALEPFAAFAALYDKQRPLTAFADDDVVYQFNDHVITVGMLRAARAAIAKAKADAITPSLTVVDLTHAITQALIADPRPWVEVYAEVAQREAWRALWGSLSEGERERVVREARKDAGR